MPDEFIRVAALSDLPDETPVGVDLENGDSLCIVKVHGEVYAFQNRCTHAEFPMSDGDMVDEYVIECGLHGAQFDVRSGEVLELPATENLPCYEVKVENGQVLVRAKPGSAPSELARNALARHSAANCMTSPRGIAATTARANPPSCQSASS